MFNRKKSSTSIFLSLFLVSIGLFGIFNARTAQKVYADSPTGTSAIVQNSTATTVDIVLIGTDFGHFASSGNVTAGSADLSTIIYNGTNPLSANIDNATTITLTFPIEMGTGKSSGDLVIIAGTIEDFGNNPNGLISVGNGSITDNAIPLILDRRTADADDDGKIDGIIFMASEALNDQFDGLTIAISGYDNAVIGTGLSPNDAEFIVTFDENLENCDELDQAGCDTDETPDTRITANTTLSDLAVSPNEVGNDSSAVASTDGASPLLIGAEFKTDVYSEITYNALVLTYTEPLDIATDGLTADGLERPSSAALGAMAAVRTVTGVGSWDGNSNMTTNAETDNRVVLDNSGTILTVFFNTEPGSFFKSGSAAPTTPTFTPIADSDQLSDVSGNPVNAAVTVVATNPSLWDITPPTIANTYSCDPDGDGDINRIQVNFSEAMWDRSIDAGKFKGDDDQINNDRGEETPVSFNTATAACDGMADDTDANDDKVRFEFEKGIKGTEAAFLHHVASGTRDHAGNLLAVGDALGEENDRAAPVIIDFKYEDARGNNGRIDQFTISFSETVSAENSFLSPNDFIFNNVGDFLGCAFGSDLPAGRQGTTDLLITDGISAVLELGTEASVVDTFEDSGKIEIATQNAFVLEDLAGNANVALVAQSQANFSDGAAPSIKYFTYLDSDDNGRVDEFLLTYSEQVTEASFLSANDLLFTNIGDFEGAVFGSNPTDLIIEATSNTTVSLGTESTAEDTSEDSGNIAITTQNSFVLSDGLNVNARKIAQSQATFTDIAMLTSLTSMEVAISEEEEMMEMVAPTELLVEAAIQFNDIAGHWAESYINQIADLGIVSGKQAGLFAPNDLMTRAELIKVAINAFGFEVPEIVTVKPFVDVGVEVWYAPYIQAAKENAIVQGDGTRFNPNQPVTRAETLKILIEAAGFIDVFENYQANYASKVGWTYVFFPDVPIGEWYARYVAYAKDFEIVSGYPDNTFRPGNPVTRAEVAKMVLNVLEVKEE